MSWALPWVEKLKRGETVQFRPRGHSMKGKVNDGDLVTVVPVKFEPWPAICPVMQGDIVLCKVKSKYFLHLVVSEGDGTGTEFLIGNNRGYTNGWTLAKNIFGKVIRVEK
jgi:hypothetical protein